MYLMSFEYTQTMQKLHIFVYLHRALISLTVMRVFNLGVSVFNFHPQYLIIHNWLHRLTYRIQNNYLKLSLKERIHQHRFIRTTK